MPDDPSTDSGIESPWLDFDDWESPFDLSGHPDAALLLGVNLTILQSHITEPGTINEAIGEIDAALEALFARTKFPDVSYTLFRRLTQGNQSAEERELLESLGITL